jgi:hypothetical protein
VSVPQIHRIIDGRILPDDLYSTTQMRRFRTDACVLIAFYFETQGAAMVEGGVPAEEILESYPSLKVWQVELAPVNARAVPPKGRPKRSRPSNISEAKSCTKKRLRPQMPKIIQVS